MDRHILLAFPGRLRDLADQIEEAILDNFDEFIVDQVGNEEEARKRLANPAIKYDAVITHLFLAKDRKSPLVEEEQRGLGLLQSLEQKEGYPFGILLADSYEEDLFFSIQELPRSRLVTLESKTWKERLLDCLRKAIEFFPENVEKPAGDIGNVDIILDLKKQSWYYTLNSVQGPYNATGPLEVEATQLEKLIKESGYIDQLKSPDWEEKFRDIGSILKEQIFKKNVLFYKNFCDLQREVGGKENLRIRFVVAKEVHPIAFEALLEEPDDKYWMLNAPIYRKLRGVAGERYPLFRGPDIEGGVMNCLIIQADIEEAEKVNGIKIKEGEDLVLEPLKNVALEVAWLEEFLQQKKTDFSIGKVNVLRPEPGEGEFSARVESELRRHHWHLVHYGGHSFYDVGKKKGFVFFPDRYIKPVSIETFGTWLKDARLVFLSSCHSSERDFVFELAENGVPAILGFRWDIEDDLAFEYTKTFYSEAFGEKSLDRAFFKAGQKMKNDYESEKIWAAPILVMQVGD